MARYVGRAERALAEFLPLDTIVRLARAANPSFTPEDLERQFRQAAAEGDAWPWRWDPPREIRRTGPPPGYYRPATVFPPGTRAVFGGTGTPTPNDRGVWEPPRGSGRHPERHWFEVEINFDTGEVCDDFGMSKSQARRHAKWRRLLIHRFATLLRIWSVTDLVLAQGTDEPALLREAPDERVHRVITDIYNEAETGGSKPPNKKQLVEPVQARLRAAGYTKSGRRIVLLAGDPRHDGRRWKAGQNSGQREIE